MSTESKNGAPAYGRVLLKLSGEALMGDREYGTDPERVQAIAQEIATVHRRGVEVAIVVGGGNIYRGLAAAARGMDRATGDYMGMLATVLNALALQDALEKSEVPTRVQSAITISEVAEPYIRRRAIRHLEKGRVVIFAAGTGQPVLHHRHGRRAARRRGPRRGRADGQERHRGRLHGRPGQGPERAQFIPELTHKEALTQGLQVMDSTAFALCMDNNLPIVVFNMADGSNINRIVSGERVGTLVKT